MGNTGAAQDCTCCKNQKWLIKPYLVIRQALPDLPNLFMNTLQPI